VLKKFVTQ